MSDIANLTKSEAVEFLTKVINEGLLYKGDLGDQAQPLESAIRIAIAHLSDGETTKVATAVEAIFQMYRRNDTADKAYRNAARFILSVVDGVPSRYEFYSNAEDDRLSNLLKSSEAKE